MSDSKNGVEKLVGLEISGEFINAVSTDGSGKIIDQHKVSIPADGESFGLVVELIGELKDRFGDFDKIGIAVPGLIDRLTKQVVYSTFISEHHNTNFFADLESKAGVTVTVENDANAAAYGEFLVGAGKGNRNMFFVTLGTGVGGAFIFGGEIWRGAAGFAGEFGHISVRSDGSNLEGVASARSIVERTKNRFHQDDTSSLSRIGENKITLYDIVNAANNEDDFAQMMLERTGNYVGSAIASVINLLNIEKIVINGAVMQAGEFVLDAVKSRAKEISFKPSFDSTEIVAGELGENAGAIGVALLTIES